MKTLTKWRVLAPLSLAAVGAAALGVAALLKKLSPVEDAAETAAPAKAAAPANQKTGSYSFISGYKDAATLDVTLDYDPDKYSFFVIEEDFPSYTSDSHVAVLSGEDFRFQLEYAGYYLDEGFEDLIRHVSEKYQGFAPVAYGDNTGVSYTAGDNVCLCFPAGEDPYSYLLITLFKCPGWDGEVADLLEHEDFAAVMSSMKVASHR